MAYDLAHIPLNELQTIFLDKDTGLPLSGGRITFYKDNARTELKDIFHLHGGYGFYEYVSLPNPSTLSSIGTFIDENGNDVVPYAYPYDSAGNQELYYITVESSDGRPQLTRDAVPWNPSSTTPIIETTDNINYVKNGQFNELNAGILANSTYNLSASSLEDSDENYRFYLNGSSQNNEYGSIFIVRDILETVDTIAIRMFSEYPLSGETPDGFASRYAYFASPGSSDTETIRDLRFIIGDYGMFADSDITIAVTGLSNYTGNSSKIKVYALQHNGEISDVVTFSYEPVEQSFTNSLAKYFFKVHVPALASGAAYQGYFAIGIRFPLNIASQIAITNVQVNPGFIELPYAYDGEAMTAAVTIADKMTNIPEPGTDSAIDYPIGFNGASGLYPVLSRNTSNVSVPFISWAQAIPTGLICPWSGTEGSIPLSFKILDGRQLSSYKFSSLFSQYTSAFSNPPIYGYGSCAVGVAGDTLTTIVTNSVVGVCIAPFSAVSGVSVTIAQGGDATHALVYNIAVDAMTTGATIGLSGAITVYTTPNKQWNIRFVVDNVTKNTSITSDMIYDDSTVLVHIRSNWTAEQISQAILTVFKRGLCFNVPDYRAMFPRGVNGARADGYADTDAATRANRGDGTGGNVVGTTQLDETFAHIHGASTSTSVSISVTAYVNANTYPAAGARTVLQVGPNDPTVQYPVVCSASGLGSSSTSIASTGGSETRPCNIYCYWIIKT